MTDPRQNKKLPFMIQYLFLDKPNNFINFIEKVFEAEELRERAVNEGNVVNALFDIAGSQYEISQARGEFKQTTHNFHLYTANMANILEKAEAEGCQIKYKFEKMIDYGDEESWFVDPFDNNWFIATPLK